MSKYGIVDGWDITEIPSISFTDEDVSTEFMATTPDRFVSDFELQLCTNKRSKNYINIIIWTKSQQTKNIKKG
jgi:hypothetical protein